MIFFETKSLMEMHLLSHEMSFKLRLAVYCIRNHRNYALVCNVTSCRSYAKQAFIGSVSSVKNSLTAKICRRWTRNASLVAHMSSSTQPLDDLTFERIVDHTLDHLTEQLDTIVESSDGLEESDVSLNNGVITLNLGLHGVYVINKQTPNKQIWLSSPVSGPKRYDYVNDEWIYKRDGLSLYSLLSSELSVILKRDIKFNEKLTND